MKILRDGADYTSQGFGAQDSNRAPETDCPFVNTAEYTIDRKQRQVTVKFPRKVTAATIERYSTVLRNNPGFAPDFAEIVDLTDVEELDLHPEEFIRLADEVDPFAPEARRAFIVRTSVQNHAARMHKALRTSKNLEVFRSREEAQVWINSARSRPASAK